MLKDLILRASDLKVTPVEVPEWNLTVHVRKLSVGEVNSVIKAGQELNKTGDEPYFFALVACKALCDENGQRVFADTDVEALKAKSFEAVSRVAMAAAEFNGLNQKALDDAKKN